MTPAELREKVFAIVRDVSWQEDDATGGTDAILRLIDEERAAARREAYEQAAAIAEAENAALRGRVGLLRRLVLAEMWGRIAGEHGDLAEIYSDDGAKHAASEQRRSMRACDARRRALLTGGNDK